jgi:hypothetical protein
MVYTIEKARPPKKEKEKEAKIEKRKDNDVMFAIFGDYEKKIENLNN